MRLGFSLQEGLPAPQVCHSFMIPHCFTWKVSPGSQREREDTRKGSLLSKSQTPLLYSSALFGSRPLQYQPQSLSLLSTGICKNEVDGICDREHETQSPHLLQQHQYLSSSSSSCLNISCLLCPVSTFPSFFLCFIFLYVWWNVLLSYLSPVLPQFPSDVLETGLQHFLVMVINYQKKKRIYLVNIFTLGQSALVQRLPDKI